MRNITTCHLQLDPGTRATEFANAVVDKIFPSAGDAPRAADDLFVCSLFAEGTAMPTPDPVLVCLVDSTIVSDDHFHGMRGPLTELGATVTRPPRMWPIVGSIPDDATVTASEVDDVERRSPSVAALHGLLDLLLVELRVPADRDAQEFSHVLIAALTSATEQDWANSVRWCRVDDAEPGFVNYLCKFVGSFRDTELPPHTLELLNNGGAEIVESVRYAHLGTVVGGAFTPAAPQPTGRGRRS